MLAQQEKQSRAKKQREIQDDLKAARFRKEIKRRNLQRLKEELGAQETLTKFHEPVIEEMRKQEETRHGELRKIQEAIQDISLLPPLESTRYPEVEGVRGMFQEGPVLTINLNKDLDERFIRSLGFQMPSELVNKTDEELDEIINTASDRNKRFGAEKGPKSKAFRKADEREKIRLQSQIDAYDVKMKQVKQYIRALKALKEGNNFIGDGMNPLTHLNDLTKKLCSGKPSKKLHNQIVKVLDYCLKNGDMTSEHVKAYYNKYLF